MRSGNFLQGKLFLSSLNFFTFCHSAGSGLSGSAIKKIASLCSILVQFRKCPLGLTHPWELVPLWENIGSLSSETAPNHPTPAPLTHFAQPVCALHPPYNQVPCCRCQKNMAHYTKHLLVPGTWPGAGNKKENKTESTFGVWEEGHINRLPQ